MLKLAKLVIGVNYRPTELFISFSTADLNGKKRRSDRECSLGDRFILNLKQGLCFVLFLSVCLCV